MLTKKKVIHLVLTLLKGGDIELLKDGSVLKAGGCSDEDQKKIKEIGKVIAGFYTVYDYCISPIFLNQIVGKSEVYRNKRIKMESSAIKRKKHNELFISAVRELQTSNAIYDLLPFCEHEKIKELVRLINSLNLEDGI